MIATNSEDKREFLDGEKMGTTESYAVLHDSIISAQHLFFVMDAMRKACQAFLGEHDFASFCAAGAQVQTTVRTIYSLEVLEQPLGSNGRTEAQRSQRTQSETIELQPDKARLQGSQIQQAPERLLTIRVRGNGFLYNMVRIIAGTLVEVGRGHIRPEEIEGIIAACDRAKAGPTAPAKGLKLVKIEYLQ